MGRMSLATRSRVVSLSQSGYPISKIQKHLEKEGTMVSKKSLHLLLKKYKMTGSVVVSFPDPPSGGCGERERRRVWAITPGGSVQEECCGYTIIERVCGFCGLASRTRIHTGMCNSPPTIFCTRKELQRRRWRFVRYAVKTSLRTGVQGLR